MRRLHLSAVVLAGAVVVLAGCGGGGGSSSSGSSGTSATDWAASYCKNATSWVTSLDQARASVKSGSSTASDAAQTVSTESTTFIQAVNGQGSPDTPNGSTSQATAKSLATTLSGRVARMSAAIDTNNSSVTAAQQTAIVKQQIAASLTDIKTTNATLAKDDPELGTAMKASSDCKSLDAALAKASA